MHITLIFMCKYR